jgi:hypothetical protein
VKFKIFSTVIALGIFWIAPANAGLIYEVPKQVSLTVDQKMVEISAGTPSLNFELVVSHPVGIKSVKTPLVFVSRDGRFSFESMLYRTDLPTQFSLQKVTFKGTLTIPTYAPAGIYDFYASPIDGLTNTTSDLTPTSGRFYPEKFNSFMDAEQSVLVRVNGKLNVDAKTFVGPSYDSSVYLQDNKPRTLFTSAPIYRVGEIYDPNKYFEKRVDGIGLKIESKTPSTCSSDSKVLKYTASGNCEFRVYTEANNDYLETTISLNVSVISARTKLFIEFSDFKTQTLKEFPKQIELTQTYSSAGIVVNPISKTPSVCLMTGTYLVSLLAPGTCTLEYSAAGSEMFLPSDVYLKSFEVIKEGQPVVVPTPVATPTPTATPTATPKPVVKKTISCVKGTKTIKKTAISPKCPAGYKLKK